MMIVASTWFGALHLFASDCIRWLQIAYLSGDHDNPKGFEEPDTSVTVPFTGSTIGFFLIECAVSFRFRFVRAMAVSDVVCLG